jgi:hypothetical protein
MAAAGLCSGPKARSIPACGRSHRCVCADCSSGLKARSIVHGTDEPGQEFTSLDEPHGSNHGSGFQPLISSWDVYLGPGPRLVWSGPSALGFLRRRGPCTSYKDGTGSGPSGAELFLGRYPSESAPGPVRASLERLVLRGDRLSSGSEDQLGGQLGEPCARLRSCDGAEVTIG